MENAEVKVTGTLNVVLSRLPTPGLVNGASVDSEKIIQAWSWDGFCERIYRNRKEVTVGHLKFDLIRKRRPIGGW